MKKRAKAGAPSALRDWAPVGLSLVLLVAAIVATVAEPTAMTTLRHAAFDAYQRLQPREYRPAPVRVIDIDEESLDRHGQWPWPRTTLATLIERLDEAGARSIALDVMLAEPDRTSPQLALESWAADPAVRDLVARLPDHDEALEKRLAASPVVTGFILDQETQGETPLEKGRMVLAGDPAAAFLPPFRGAVTSLRAFEAAAAGNGALNMIPSNDGIVRQLPLLLGHGGAVRPGLAAEALRVAEGADNYVVKASGASGEGRFGGRTGIVNVRIGDLEPIVTDARGAVWLHYSDPVPERTLPAWKVLAGDVPEGALEGGILFLGTSAAGLHDLRLDPLGRIAPGAEVHAQGIEQILQGTYLTRPDWARAAEILFMVAMWFVLVALILRFGALPAAVIGIATIAAAYLGSWFAFDRLRLLLDPTFPSLSALSIYFVCSVAQHWRAERDRTWIRDAFSSYISPNLVRHLIDNPGDLALGGERRECSFVMTDLESFTTLVENLEPTVAVSLLNEYLDGIVDIALARDGTIDRIVGDAVAVMFSAPAVQPDHAERAVACALEIDAFARRFSAARGEQGVEVGRTRIGVNTGVVTVGNVGGDRIVDYRALGDPVNTAARLETVNRHLGTNVCVSAATVAACPDFHGRPIGRLLLKGKSEAVEAFEPLSREEAAGASNTAYLRAFALMEEEAAEAPAAFDRLRQQHPDDPLVALHADRLAAGETGSTIAFSEK